MAQLPARSVDLDANLAVRSYFNDQDWMFKTGLGGVLNAACLLVGILDVQRFLFVPVALAFAGLVSGYLLRTARMRVGDPTGKLPEWSDWSDLFFTGLSWLAVQFGLGVLFAIPFTTIAIGASFLIATSGSNAGLLGFIVAVMCVSMLFLLLLAHLLISYLMLNFAAEEKLLAGFAFRKVVTYILKAPRALLTAWVLSFQLQIFAVVMPVLTVLGAFIIPSTFFAAQLVGVSMMAQAWHLLEEKDKFTAQPLS